MNDISKEFKWNQCDAIIARKLLELEESPEAIKYFADKCNELTDYAYWFFLSTLWVSCSRLSDLELWKNLFYSNRAKRKKTIMKPSELKAFENLPWFVTVYRAHRPEENDYIAYTLNKDIAFRFANERGVKTIKEYQVRKKDIIALFLRRGEEEVIILNKDNVKFVREHIKVGKDITLTPWKPCDTGCVALPLKINIPNPKNKDWKLVNCDVCGEECWETDLARVVLKSEGMKAACTMCAFKEKY